MQSSGPPCAHTCKNGAVGVEDVFPGLRYVTVAPTMGRGSRSCQNVGLLFGFGRFTTVDRFAEIRMCVNLLEDLIGRIFARISHAGGIGHKIVLCFKMRYFAGSSKRQINLLTRLDKTQTISLNSAPNAR